MGESTTITHAILTIVAVVLASVFAVTVMSQLNTLLNSINIVVKNRSDVLRLGVTITYSYYNGTHVVLFIKNTGDTPYSKLDNIDVFLKSGGVVDYYSTSNADTVSIVEYGNANNVLEPSETVQIAINVAGKAYTLPIEVRVVLVNGYTATSVITE